MEKQIITIIEGEGKDIKTRLDYNASKSLEQVPFKKSLDDSFIKEVHRKIIKNSKEK